MDSALALAPALPSDAELCPGGEEPAANVESSVALVSEPSVPASGEANAKLDATNADSKPESAILSAATSPREPEGISARQQVAAGTPAVSPPPLPAPEDPVPQLPAALAVTPPQPFASVSARAPARAAATVRPSEGRKHWRWRSLTGLAAIAVLSVWLSAGGDESPHQSGAQALGQAPLVAESSELGTRAPELPPLASAITDTDATFAAEAEAAAPATDGGKEEDSAARSAPRGPRPVRALARRAVDKTVADADAASASAVPYDKATLTQALSSVQQKAAQCDLWGRATGTAKLFVTFEPSGRVSEARLEGEPLASSAVARCILHHARAAALPPFAGPAFTVSRSVTLR